MSDGNTSAVKQGINIRTIEDAEEMSVCVELQQRIWGYARIPRNSPAQGHRQVD